MFNHDRKHDAISIETMEQIESDKQFGSSIELVEDPYRLPPRRLIHPSERGKWTKRFYQLLVLLFIALLICMFLWGNHTTKSAL